MEKLFIAEIGINHHGDFTKALRMIEKAKEAGADIAKFQFYRPLDILGFDSPYLRYATQCFFTQSQHEALALHCDHVGIEYLVSVFDRRDVKWADSLCRRHKIATRMNRYSDFIDDVRHTGKQVVMSIQKETLLPEKIDFMWCTPKYPATKADVLDNTFGSRFGLSSHCPDYTATVEAAAKGATIFENHVCENKKEQGCDIPASITFADYTKMVRAIRD